MRVKIKKSQLKELVRQSIFDEIQEGGPGSGKPKKDWEKHAMDASDAANKKMDADRRSNKN